MRTPGKENVPGQGGREVGTVAAPRECSAKDTEFPRDKRGRPILDAAAMEVLQAWRFFNIIPGDLPAIVAALLVVAWAIKGRLSW